MLKLSGAGLTIAMTEAVDEISIKKRHKYATVVADT